MTKVEDFRLVKLIDERITIAISGAKKWYIPVPYVRDGRAHVLLAIDLQRTSGAATWSIDRDTFIIVDGVTLPLDSTAGGFTSYLVNTSTSSKTLFEFPVRTYVEINIVNESGIATLPVRLVLHALQPYLRGSAR